MIMLLFRLLQTSISWLLVCMSSPLVWLSSIQASFFSFIARFLSYNFMSATNSIKLNFKYLNGITEIIAAGASPEVLLK